MAATSGTVLESTLEKHGAAAAAQASAHEAALSELRAGHEAAVAGGPAAAP